MGDEFTELVKGSEEPVGECPFEAPPDLFGRVEFRTIGREEQRQDVFGPAQPLCLVEGAVVQEQDLEFIGPFSGEVVKEDLEGVGRAMGQFQMKVMARDGRVGPEKPSGLEDLLKGAYRLDPLRGESFARAGEESEAALILRVQVHRSEPLAALGDQVSTVLGEVFLKASAANGSFKTCDLRAVLT